ncbi:MAG: DUF4124 domain-containing protein [Usitatibacter sp.]
MPDTEARRALSIRAGRAVLLAALLCGVDAQAQIYKWVDAQGRTHYGEKPADGTPATAIAAPSPPSEPARSNNPEKWKEMERDLRTRRLDKARAEEAQQKKQDSAERKRECANAQRQITILERQAPVYSRDAKGERVYASDEVREKELQAWKRAYQDNCS